MRRLELESAAISVRIPAMVIAQSAHRDRRFWKYTVRAFYDYLPGSIWFTIVQALPGGTHVTR